MLKLILGLAVSVAAFTAPFAMDGKSTGTKPPPIDSVKWYNSAPFSFEDLEGKAVLVDVFRTW